MIAVAFMAAIAGVVVWAVRGQYTEDDVACCLCGNWIKADEELELYNERWAHAGCVDEVLAA